MSSPLSKRGSHHAPPSYPRWLAAIAPFAFNVTGAVVAFTLTAAIAAIGYATVGITAPPLVMRVAPVTHAAASSSASTMAAVAASTPQLATVPLAATYHVVTSGDTLSRVSASSYGRAACWPGIYRASRATVGADPDLIYPGQHLVIPAACDNRALSRPAASAPAQAPVSHAAASISGDEDTSAPQRSAASHTPPAASRLSSASGSSSGSYAVSSAFQACVIRAESGGNPQIWNASGHWGLYQFSYSTWVGHGGAPGLFGHADGAYQTQIFWNTVHADGTSDWAPYDGC